MFLLSPDNRQAPASYPAGAVLNTLSCGDWHRLRLHKTARVWLAVEEGAIPDRDFQAYAMTLLKQVAGGAELDRD